MTIARLWPNAHRSQLEHAATTVNIVCDLFPLKHEGGIFLLNEYTFPAECPLTILSRRELS